VRTERAQPSPTRAAAVVATLVVCASVLHAWGVNTADEDLWNHVTWGRAMLADGAVLRIDRWSYTAAGAPFFDHEWLADVVFAALFDRAGSAGLVALKLVLGATTVVAMLGSAGTLARARGLAGGVHPATAAATLVLALASVGPGAAFRPQLFTMALLAVEWALLERADARMDAGRSPGWTLAAVPPLVALWANLHGGFLIGVALAGTFTVAALLRGPHRRLGVLAAALATVAAPLANPYGLSLYGYLLATLGMHGRITEWMPIVPWDASHLRFTLLVVATAAAVLPWWWRGRGSRGGLVDWRVAFLAVAALVAFRQRRHTVLFAIAAAPVLLVALETWRRAALARRPALRPRRRVAAAIAAGAIAVAGVQAVGVAGPLAAAGGGIRIPSDEFPTAAVTFLRASGVAGNVAVPFEWGAYALYHLGDRIRVFIDGRFEAVYPPAVIEDWFRFADGRRGWERLLDAYPTDVVVIERTAEVRAALQARTDFVQVYGDPIALVFVRRTAAGSERLERLARLVRPAGIAAQDELFP